MKISVIGLGYVGLSLALLLAKDNEVVGMDIDEKRISKVKTYGFRIFQQGDVSLSKYDTINFRASLMDHNVLAESECIIVTTSTDCIENECRLNTSSVEEVVHLCNKLNPDALIVIKSTVPIGFTDFLREKYKTENIIFSPEFLREGKELYDNIFPSRIIVGDNNSSKKWFADLLLEISENKDIPIMHTNSCEAESIKLFSNCFLAMRIAFFNELDSFSDSYSLDSKTIIEGIGMDERIGNIYNNPSFGYGGYCLPKDTKQLQTQFRNIPVALIPSITSSNELRQEYIFKKILSKNSTNIGIYRLAMKSGSDNSRSAAILPIISKLIEHGKKVVVYETETSKQLVESLGAKLQTDLEDFKSHSDIIIANRYDDSLADVLDKLFSRDLFHTN